MQLSENENVENPAKYVREYMMIKAKKIEYLDSPAIAIYLTIVTQHVNQIRLESQILEEKNRNESLESLTQTISHDYRAPLGTSLMLIEQLLNQQLSQNIIQILNLIFSQLNLLLWLVHDVLDLRKIQQGSYEPKHERFNP